MAHVGQVITNPLTTERITFLKTSRETDGELLLFDCRANPGGARLPAHVHRTYEERFEIISGWLGVMLGGVEYLLPPGQRMVLPAGIKHQWWNAGKDEVHFRVTVVPPRELETVLEVVCEMAHRGKLNRKCMPRNPFELANLGILSETYLPGVPVFMQRMALATLASIGQLFGYGPDFPAYRTPAASAEGAAAIPRAAA